MEKKPVVKKELAVPKKLITALNKNKKAKTTFESFSPSNKRAYVAWITEAKTEDTKNKRLALP